MDEHKEELIYQEKQDCITQLQCNLDDMSAEDIGYAMEVLLHAGALDVFTTPIGMKKSRSGILFTVLCKEEQKKELAQLIFKHTSTIGIREYSCNRMILNRREEILQTEYGPVRVKKSYGYGVEKTKPEYDDLKIIAQRTGKSLAELRNEILKS